MRISIARVHENESARGRNLEQKYSSTTGQAIVGGLKTRQNTMKHIKRKGRRAQGKIEQKAKKQSPSEIPFRLAMKPKR